MVPSKRPKKSAPIAPVLVHSGRVIGTAIGIENYKVPRTGSQLPKVDFARNDAEAFKTTIESAMPGADIQLLLDQDATASSLEYDLKQVIGGLQEDDLFIFYYAGHGYHDVSGNRITAWDSNSFNPADTTLLLEDLVIKPLRQSACNRALIFIDACAVALRQLVKSREVMSDLSPEELKDFLGSAAYCATFVSCRPGQKSYPSEEYKHGVWTYFLLRALRGEAAEALGPGRYLTDSGLRDYLATVVPKYITTKRVSSGTQNPVAILDGTQSFAIIEAKEIVRNVVAAEDLSLLQLEAIEDFLEAVEEKNFSALPGFVRGRNFVPDSATEATDRFMREKLQELVNEEVNDIYIGAKKAFGLRQRDFEQSADGAEGLVECEHFRYSMTPKHLSSDPTRYRITRRLQLRDGWEMKLEAFDEVFDRRFTRVVARFKPDVDAYNQLVERFEDIEEMYGGTLDENAARSKIKYVDQERYGVEVDLSKGRLVLTGPQSHANVSEHREVARRIRFGIRGPVTVVLRDR